MLAKLLKYELRATARVLLPLYAVLVLIALGNRLLAELPLWDRGFHIPGVIAGLVLFAMIVAVLVITLVILIQRFYQTMTGEAGYLMLTLPVPVSMHILSKLLTAMLWILATGAALIASVCLLSATGAGLVALPGQMLDFMKALLWEVDGRVSWLIVLICLLLLVSVATSVLQIYMSIALGNLFDKNRALASFGMYLAVSMAFQVLFYIGVVIVASVDPTLEWFSMLVRGVDELGTIMIIIGLMLTAEAVIGAVFFLVTNYILERRLNLQ